MRWPCSLSVEHLLKSHEKKKPQTNKQARQVTFEHYIQLVSFQTTKQKKTQTPNPTNKQVNEKIHTNQNTKPKWNKKQNQTKNPQTNEQTRDLFCYINQKENRQQSCWNILMLRVNIPTIWQDSQKHRSPDSFFRVIRFSSDSFLIRPPNFAKTSCEAEKLKTFKQDSLFWKAAI